MTDTITRIDYAAARERLASITTDPEVMAGFDRIAASGDLDDAFMAAAIRLNISIDWVFFGEGKPITARKGAMTSTTKIDWDAIKDRVASRTQGPAVIASLDRMRASGEIDDTFASWVIEGDVSLDWLIFDRGLPIMSNARLVGRVVAS